MTPEAGKTYTTRDGLTAKVLCTDAPGKYPVVGYIVENDDVSNGASWAADGRYLVSVDKDGCDLLAEVKPMQKREMWANVYPRFVIVFLSEAAADRCAFPGRIARVPVTISYREGEGL